MVKVLIKTDTRYPVDRKIVRRAVEDTFKKYKIENADFEVSVAVVGARKMKKLTEDYLMDNSKHQILTFALEEVSEKPKVLKGESKEDTSAAVRGFVNAPDGFLRLGDIILSWPQTVAEAGVDEVMVSDKIYELVAHGAEHLLGFNHE